MNSRFTRKKHSIDSLAALLLFAMYVLFLLFLMLFGAGNYQASVKNLDTNNNLYTASSYITTKFRQHDIPGKTSLTEIQGTQVLCFQETIEGKDYCTYIYFDGSHLKDHINGHRWTLFQFSASSRGSCLIRRLLNLGLVTPE